MLLDDSTIDSALMRSAVDLLAESSQPAVVLDLQSLSRLSESDLVAVERWSRRQPCPVVGKGHESLPAVTCVDAVVESDAELNTMLRRVAVNPQAAAVLVQVLRTIEHLSPLDGLVVESLGYATLQFGEEFRRWLTQYQSQNPAAPTKESGPPVRVERNADQLTLVLNRPGNGNAYSVELRDALMEAFSLVELDASIRQVRVSAEGRCFCTGGELTEFGVVSSPVSAHMIRSHVSPARLLLSASDRYHFHVHGACVGSGIELPACAGYLSASAKTLFWLPELSMGLIPGAGGCVSISRRIGRQRTAYMVLMNKKIDARKALEWGLIDEIFLENS
jgi:enoyl-CoA hydratase/carnithine racemase